MPIDLHPHTVASDGLLDAAQLIRLAGEAGGSVLAVTDHDSTESVEAAMRSGREAGIDVVPAVELNTDVPGAEVHILGYFIDHRLEWLQGLLRRLRGARLDRAGPLGENRAAPGGRGGDGMVDGLLAAGLEGIEAYYPDHTPAMVERYLEVARRFNLLVNGGTDFHGGGLCH